MKKQSAISLTVVICILVFGGFGYAWFTRQSRNPFRPGADRLLLLVPNGTDFSDSRVTVWLDAASEEGLHVVPMHDSTFLRPIFGRPPCAGIIVPDSIHVRASDLLIGALRDYVAAGGKLMLVYDAGTESQDGFYSGDQSRLSDLAGIRYALYNSLRNEMIQTNNVSGTIPVMNALGIPPGKYFPLSPPSAKAGVSTADAFQVEIRRYKYGGLPYPSFVTSGTYSGQVLLRSQSGIVAGLHRFKKGCVLFVNLPLAYLKLNTDGLPLHAFLKYFAAHVLSLPYLLAVPDGVGGLVLDWHVDSNAAIKPLEEMNQWTILKQGPFSIDITAGPDTYAIGDQEGFNVLHNPVSQDLVREYVRLGEEVGSHGGWIHNYFAAHVENGNRTQMEQFLELNKDALEKIGGKPVLEYSAPNGDQPLWVTQWLEHHGFLAYYFTGDTGMGPTQGYRNGQRVGQNIWAFPILHLDRAASFEETGLYHYSNSVVAQWLDLAADFSVTHREVRLIYFHPPGIMSYRQVVHNWLEKTAELRAQGVFRWYTMVQIARFLNSRKQVQWKLIERGKIASLVAFSPRGLEHQTWWLPLGKFSQPRVTEGTAVVQRGRHGWLVVAGGGTNLKVETGVIN
jgi:hypothetical protein